MAQSKQPSVFKCPELDTEDNVASTYTRHKAEMLSQIKNNEAPYIKFPVASGPLQSKNNPDLWTMLWPTLFPYGIGFFLTTLYTWRRWGISENLNSQTHPSPSLPTDTHFQLHISFSFVTPNILHHWESSSSSRLHKAVQWAEVHQELPAIFDALMERLVKEPTSRAKMTNKKGFSTS